MPRLVFHVFELVTDGILAYAGLPCVHVSLTSYPPCEGGVIMMSVFQTKTPRHKKWGGRAQSRTVDEWQNPDSHPRQPGSEAVRRRGRCSPMRSCSFRTVASPRGWRAETRRLSEAGAVTQCLPVCYTGYPILTSRHLFRASVFRDGDRSPLAQSPWV